MLGLSSPRYCIAHPLLQNVCVHLPNERDFPQAKLGNAINARFLLNEHTPNCDNVVIVKSKKAKSQIGINKPNLNFHCS